MGNIHRSLIRRGTLRQHLPQLGSQPSRHPSVTLWQMHTNKSVHSRKGLEGSKSSETRYGLDGQRETMSERARRGRAPARPGCWYFEGSPRCCSPGRVFLHLPLGYPFILFFLNWTLEQLTWRGSVCEGRQLSSAYPGF